jgi:hypothetical protein
VTSFVAPGHTIGVGGAGRPWPPICEEILDSLPNLSEALAAADPELRRRVFEAFRLAVALDRNAGQIRVKALVSSALTKSRDLQNLVANEFIHSGGGICTHFPDPFAYHLTEVRHLDSPRI